MAQTTNTSNFLAIAEVRFQAIVNLAQFVKAVQLSFNQVNYHHATVLKNQGMQVEQFGAQQMLLPAVHNNFAFANQDHTRQFILNEQCLVFKVTDFHDFESFMALFQEGIYIVNKLTNIVTSERMGLRLLKRIVPRSRLSLQDYLQTNEAKLLDRFGGLTGYSHTELSHQFNDIHLLHRVKCCPYSGLELPKDVYANDMAFKSEVLNYQGPSIFLDSDGFVQKHQDLSLPTVRDNLKKIHAILGLAFQSSVSDLALSDIGFR
jgi:uncharacterized protein (TIGR04255 family)